MQTTPPNNARAARQKRGRVGPRSIRGRLLAGTLIIVPVAITGWLLMLVFNAALWAGRPLVGWAREGLRILLGIQLQPNLGAAENVVAVALTLAMLYILGWLGSNVVGQRFISVAERLLAKIPFVDTIYTSAKRMLTAISRPPGGDESSQVVVLIDFPYAPLKAIGFMTNTITDAATGRKVATVFVPTTPNPTSGYMEMVPIENVTLTDWTMEEALTTILSGGASAPSEFHTRPMSS